MKDVLGEVVRDLSGQIDEQVRERTKVEKARLDEMTAEVEKTQENLQKARQSIQLVVISDPAEWPEWVANRLLQCSTAMSAIWEMIPITRRS